MADCCEQPPMAWLGRDVAHDAMIERMRVNGKQDRGGSGRGEAVAHDRHATEPRRHDCPGDRRKFEPAQAAQQIERVA